MDALYKMGVDLWVIYFTDGSRGVPLKYSGKYSGAIRQHEAKIALRIIGYNIKSEFLNMKFYRIKRKEVFEEDINTTEKVLRRINPDHILVCADTDPHRTHKVCYEIL